MVLRASTCLLDIEQTSLLTASTLSSSICALRYHHERNVMGIGTILLIILVLILLGVFPTWGYSRSWGYAPSGVTGLIIIVLLILLLTGRI
jgi:hypothetical protein